MQTYTYKATVVKVVDGDTIDFKVDLGFHVSVEIRTRLLGINAPEMNTPEGKMAREFVVNRVAQGPIEITTFKDAGDKYGRWLALVVLADRQLLNDLMVSSGHAVIMKV
jgi:micrococcal nuclease